MLWSFEAEHLSTHGVPDQGLPLTQSLTLPIARNLGEPDQDRYRNRNVRGTSWLTTQLGAGWLLTAAVSALAIDARISQVGVMGASLAGTVLTREGATTTDGSSRSYFPRLDLAGRLSTGNVTHSVLAGVEGGAETYDVRRVGSSTQSSIDVFNPVHAAPLLTGDGARAARSRAVRSLGFFAQDQIALTSKWRALVGARLDALWLHDEEPNRPSAPPAPPQFAGPGDASRPGFPDAAITSDVPIGASVDAVQTSAPVEVTPRLGVVYYVQPRLSVYASYARSFNPPVLNLGTTSFEPTHGRQCEGGVKFGLLGTRLHGSAAVFAILKRGQVVGGGVGTLDIDAPSSTQRSTVWSSTCRAARDATSRSRHRTHTYQDSGWLAMSCASRTDGRSCRATTFGLNA
jgi:iron complex outermembrane receptor protein